MFGEQQAVPLAPHSALVKISVEVALRSEMLPRHKRLQSLVLSMVLIVVSYSIRTRSIGAEAQRLLETP
jgi:hypothetical protein